MNKFEVQQVYWESFGLLAFNEQTVPDNVPDAITGDMIPLRPPYITYEPVSGSLDGQMTATARVWFRGTSWAPIMGMVTQMEKTFDRTIPFDGGVMKVRKPLSNFAQPMSDPNDEQLRTIVLNAEIEFLAK